jgi:hypothetical protein
MPTLRITSPYCVEITDRLRTSGLIIHEYKIISKLSNFYKIEIIVLWKHQALRHQRNSPLDIKIASNSMKFAWQPRLQALRLWRLGRVNPTPRAPARSGQGGVMIELRTRLNVLAAVISFAFLTAVVFGMF